MRRRFIVQQNKTLVVDEEFVVWADSEEEAIQAVQEGWMGVDFIASTQREVIDEATPRIITEK